MTLEPFKTRIGEIEEHLLSELSAIRTGRATPLLLDHVMVESYGAKMPVKHVAAISVEDARTLRVTPWDASQMKAVETAIVAANLGVSSSPQGDTIRLSFPELSEERRKLLVKLAKEKLEEARISVRRERDGIRSDLHAQEKAGTLSEDAKFKLQDELQTSVDEANARLEEAVAKKEREILA